MYPRIWFLTRMESVLAKTDIAFGNTVFNIHLFLVQEDYSYLQEECVMSHKLCIIIQVGEDVKFGRLLKTNVRRDLYVNMAMKWNCSHLEGERNSVRARKLNKSV